ncbi:hypothetical protein V2H45_11400 [Tumidithrix elongata RA019]|uniref:Uncharacterized protein n=1 Tax=Tumidithrix elongata BACA0141 TaxID=2716417 RepID=A0AAW9PWW1_9CYAN|nr:hypothetical protein [Tumidithrix elongata RA019]
MISRDQLKLAIDAIDDTHLEMLHRIILAFRKPIPITSNLAFLETTNPLKGSITFENDIISPIDTLWEAEQ